MNLRSENITLDRIDRQLLAADGRASMAELARRVGLSPPSVTERVRRLEDAGVIEGYGVRLNPTALGLGVAAWLRIRPVPGQLRTVVEIIHQVPEIVACDRITGEDCFIAKVQVPDVGELERVIDRFMPYAMTNTSMVQSSPVSPRQPPALLAPTDA